MQLTSLNYNKLNRVFLYRVKYQQANHASWMCWIQAYIFYSEELARKRGLVSRVDNHNFTAALAHTSTIIYNMTR